MLVMLVELLQDHLALIVAAASADGVGMSGSAAMLTNRRVGDSGLPLGPAMALIRVSDALLGNRHGALIPLMLVSSYVLTKISLYRIVEIVAKKSSQDKSLILAHTRQICEYIPHASLLSAPSGIGALFGVVFL